MSYGDNEKLLDDKGEWVYSQDDLSRFKNKVVIGFLRDSKHNVVGYFGRNSMIGYACSHIRFLTDNEIKTYCKENSIKDIQNG